MTKTYLTRTEALYIFGLDPQWFDIVLSSLDVRQIEDRVHRDDIEAFVARMNSDEHDFGGEYMMADNDNGRVGKGPTCWVPDPFKGLKLSLLPEDDE